MEHPLIALIPVESMFKSVQTAGAVALRSAASAARAIPYVGAVVIGVEVANEVCKGLTGEGLYENLINYAKGGKDAVGRSKSSGLGSGPGRVTPKYGKGEYWEGLKTKSQDSRLIAISRKAKADVRMDQDGFYYKFDPAHKTAKVHLHKYRDLGSDRYKLIEEVDPANGVSKTVTDGGVEIW
jgi:hypothetical protein